MKASLETSLELTLEQRYAIRITCVDHIIKAYSKDLQNFREWSGPITGISINMITWLKERLNWATSRFSLNPKTLEVIFLKGLKGGGCGMMKGKTSTKNNQTSSNQDILNELKENQEKAIELANSISESMGEMTIEMNKVSTLGKLNPYNCFSPYSIAIKLLENFDAIQCWSQYEYSEERAAITLIARKFLMAFFIKKEEVKFLSKTEKNEIMAKFDRIIRIIELNQNKTPELCTLVEIQIMKNLLDKVNDTKKWWQTVLVKSKDILAVAMNFDIFNPTQNLRKSIEYFRKINNQIQGNFYRYAFQFEIIEKHVNIEVDLTDQFQDLLIKEFEKTNKMKWEEVHILLEFFENCAKQGWASEEFILSVLKSHIYKLSENIAWEIRGGVVNVLRSLGGHWNKEISQESKKIREAMRSNEKDVRVKKILNLSWKSVVKTVNENIANPSFLSNKKDSTDSIIGREDIIKEINSKLKVKNILTITGKGGIGKTSVSLKYSDDYKNDYQIIWVVNGDNIPLHLACLAIKLGIQNDNDTLETFKTKLSSKEFKQSMLLIFDDLEENNQLNEYYVRNENIKYLITSRSTGWEEYLELGPLSGTYSEDLLSLRLTEQNESEENVKALSQRIGGHALGLRQSIACIKTNKFTIKEYLEFIKDLSIDEVIIKTLESIIKKFTVEALNALGLLNYFQSQDIPEEVIKSILVKKYGVKEWLRVRSQLIGCYIVNKNIEGYWSVNRIIMDFMRGRDKGEMKNMLVQYYYENPIDCDNIYSDKNRVEKTKAIIIHARNFIKELQLNRIEEIAICLKIAEANFEIHMNFKEIEKLLEMVITNERQINEDRNKESIANIWRKVGNIYLKAHKYENSEEFYTKCLEIQKQHLPPLHLNQAKIYMSMGLLYNCKADYIKSQEFYIKCKEIREKVLPPLHHDLARIYMYMGFLYSDINDHMKSEEFYMKCLEIREKNMQPLHTDLAKIYMSMGLLYIDKENYTKSEEFYIKCLEIREKILHPLHPDLAKLYMNMGNLYNKKVDYIKSEKYYIKSLEIQVQILPPLHPDLAKLYMNIGILYCGKADYVKSQEFYTKSLKIREQILPQFHPDLATLYMNMGNLHNIRADYMKSEEFYMKCLVIREKILPPHHNDLVKLYMNMRILYENKGEFFKSEEFYIKSQEI
ncbi:hypothetical protein SteCoe_30721 [Stentor coeruleus]|uniref:Uncharacterized protein n=1 Tax=Stentor coeruleus TaxID=5963 RepID=A0A1R2B396_9CILI|nr:hypothetical protein SteCoe_30721 [Stentor coeruleus]